MRSEAPECPPNRTPHTAAPSSRGPSIAHAPRPARAASAPPLRTAQIPDDVKAIYKTCWELKQRDLIDMAAERGAFIDQSQSFNVFVQDANYGKLSSMHFYGWKKGLKTGMYYLRSRAAADAIKFTVDQASLKEKTAADATKPDAAAPTAADADGEARRRFEEAKAQMVCSIDNKEACMSCGA